jgi:hypothetical protein
MQRLFVAAFGHQRQQITARDALGGHRPRDKSGCDWIDERDRDLLSFCCAKELP